MTNSMIYLLEAIVFGIILLTGVIIFKSKHKKGLLKYFGICSFVFVAVFLLTFIFEKPEMDFTTLKNIEVGSQTSGPLPKTTFHFQDVTDQVRISSDIDYNKIGEYYAQYEFDTAVGVYKAGTTINVVDTTAPEIVLEGEENYNQSYSKEYAEPGYKAVDSYEGDITDKVVVTKEEINETEYNLKYEVQDSSNNKSEKLRHIKVIDDVPPVIKINGSTNMYILVGSTYTEKGATATDEKDGDLTSQITTEGQVDTSKEGTYAIVYRVSDTSENQASAVRKVIVSKKLSSNIQAQNGTNGNKGVIYLTFDDGPSTSITPKILDILKEKNVKATFFILNYDSAGEQLVKRAYAEGHTIGIHGYSHKYAEIYQSVDTYMNNITKLQDKIKASTGYNATITRFPGGSSNTVSRNYCVGIMTALCQEVLDRGYKYFDWNVSSGDAGGAKTANDVYNNVVKGLSKSKQNVVLMHDFSGNTKTLNALANIIDYGFANGYTFDRITESTPMVTHKPNN